MEKEKKKRVKEKKEENQEKVSEIFEIEKGKNEEIVKASGIEQEKAPSEEQVKKENKTFRNIIIVMAACVLFFLATFYIINASKSFEYDGVNFQADTKIIAGTTVYRTSLPISYNGSNVNYNFYLRKDPRTLKNIVFNGTLVLQKNVVINMTNDFNCNGNGIIAVANIVNLYRVMGADVIKDENATCDPSGRYMFLRIEEGNETKIEQFGPSCYKLSISGCEILEGTEKFMIETLSVVNKKLQA